MKVAVVGGLAVALSGLTAEVTSGSAAAASPKSAVTPDTRAACPETNQQGMMFCMVLVRTDVKSRSEGVFGSGKPKGYGYGPKQLQSAYKLPSSTDGAGESVAVVDAYNDPDAVSDLATYRAAWGLPACDPSTGAGCLTVVNENGATSPLPPEKKSGWGIEEALDVDMVSAICPKCKIYLVEANSGRVVDLGTGVDSAISLLHVDFVSNSYGGHQNVKDLQYDKKYYKHPGDAIVASAGDDGYGVMYPAASQYVTAVGGTNLRKDPGSARGWSESVWSGSGSGCSEYDPKPTWQTDTGCKNRTDNDVSAVASPGTGVAVYDTYTADGWAEVGGTSVSSPIIASVYALAGVPAAGSYPASFPYSHTNDLYRVTTGSNGTCTPAYLCNGETGYSGPGGWGTPDGLAAFTG
ncbi:MAG: S8 family serine peptidase [Acidimicrobiales bacterium]